jgi:hypothetical protein
MTMAIMGTTMSLPDDILSDIKEYAESHSVSMGEATAELVRRGLTRPLPTRIVNGLHIPILPPDGKKITSEMVRKLDSDQDIKKVLPYMKGSKINGSHPAERNYSHRVDVAGT